MSAQDVVQSVTQLSLVESSVGFSVRGAARRQRNVAASQPQRRDPHSRTHRTAFSPPSALVLRKSRAQSLYPSQCLRFASSGCVSPFSRVTQEKTGQHRMPVVLPRANRPISDAGRLSASCKPQTFDISPESRLSNIGSPPLSASNQRLTSVSSNRAVGSFPGQEKHRTTPNRVARTRPTVRPHASETASANPPSFFEPADSS